MNDVTKTTPAIKTTIVCHDALVATGNDTITFTFSNGKILVLQPIEELSATIQRDAMYHGLKQKLCDAAAISRDPTTGRAATIETKFEAVREVYERLLSGEWNKHREGGGGAGGLLFRALVRLYEGRKTPEQIREYLETKNDKEKAALRGTPKIAAIIEEMRTESGEGIDTDDLLAELNDDSLTS